MANHPDLTPVPSEAARARSEEPLTGFIINEKPIRQTSGALSKNGV